VNYKHVAAVLTDSTEEKLFYHGSGHSNSSVLAGATKIQSDPVPVRGVKIDNLVGERNGKGIIKLDLESHEYDALLGGKDTLKNKDVIYIIEINPSLLNKKGESLYSVFGLMSSYGYIGRGIDDDFNIYPESYVFGKKTMNYIFARSSCWEYLL